MLRHVCHADVLVSIFLQPVITTKWTRFQASAARWVRLVLFWDITQCSIVVIHWSRTKVRLVCSWIAWPLTVGPIGWLETSVRNYHYTLPNIPEKCRSQHGGQKISKEGQKKNLRPNVLKLIYVNTRYQLLLRWNVRVIQNNSTVAARYCNQ
jgi:hypothetical protein